MKFKKTFSLILSAVLLLITFTSTIPFASALNTAKLTSGNTYSFQASYYNAYYQTGDWHDAEGKLHNNYGQAARRTLKTNNMPIYCIDCTNAVNSTSAKAVKLSDNSYWNNKLSTTAKGNIRKICIYGYPNFTYGYSAANAYLATQVLIWECQTNKRTSFANTACTSAFKSCFNNYPDAYKAYQKIAAAAADYSTKVSFNGKSIKLYNAGKSNGVTLTDSTGLLSGCTVTSNNSNVKVAKSGNKLTIYASDMSKSVAAKITITKPETAIGNEICLTGAGQTLIYGAFAGNITSTVNVEANSGSLQIKKSITGNNTNNISLSDFSFRLYNDNISYSETIKIDANGNGSLNGIPTERNYWLEEIIPDGHWETPVFTDQDKIAVENNKILIHIGKDGYGVNASISCVNQTTYDEDGLIRIIKTEKSSGKELAGAEFTLYLADGENRTELKKGITNDSGSLLFDNLELNKTYIVKETAAPDGYQLSEEERTCELTEDNPTARFSFENKLNVFNVDLYKADLTSGEPVEGAEITVYNADGEIVASGISDETGRFTAVKLTPGKYTFKETIPAEGYRLNSETFTFTVTEDGEITGDNTITDAPTEVKIKKFDSLSNTPLSGAIIQIKNSAGEVVAEKTTNENGEVVVYYLPVGNYTFKEIYTPDGYKLNKTEYAFVIDKNGDVSGDNIIMNDPTEWTILKTNTDGVALKGAEITVYDAEGNVFHEGKTDENGEMLMRYLTPGNYTFKETLPPDGYKLNKNTFSFIVDEEGNIEGDNTIVNKPTVWDIVKLDADTSEPLQNAEVTVYNSKNEIVAVKTTNENGKITLIGLVSGKYTFKETKQPDGYQKCKDTFSFEIDKNGDVSGDNIILNSQSIYTIHKIDSHTGKLLEGAEITIYNADGSEYHSGITNENGELVLTKILPGKYTFKETLPPAGYRLNKNTFSFEIDKDGYIVSEEDTIENSPTIKTITKYGVNRTLLSGAEITIYDDDGNVCYIAVTDNNGNITVSYLKPGNYTFKETKAPDGYRLNDSVFKFTVDKYGNITGDDEITDKLLPGRIVVSSSHNYDISSSVATGDSKIFNYALIVLMLAIGCGAEALIGQFNKKLNKKLREKKRK